MDMMEVWHGAAMAQPHPVTLSGGLVHFQTDMDGLMQITGSGNITVCGKNLFDGVFPQIGIAVKYRPIYVGNSDVTVSSNISVVSSSDGGYYSNLFALAGEASSGAATGTNDVHKNQSRTITPINGFITIAYRDWNGVNPATADTMIEIGTAKTTFAQYTATTAPAGTDLKSLVGINNVWSDSGNVTVTYWTH